MCGGLLGEAVGAVDNFANSINPMKQPMQWLTDNTIGKVWEPAAQLYDYSNSHPVESLAAMAAIYGGGAAGGLWGGAGAGAGEGAAAVGSGSLDMGMEGAAAYDAGLTGVGSNVGTAGMSLDMGMGGAAAYDAELQGVGSNVGEFGGTGAGAASGGGSSWLQDASSKLGTSARNVYNAIGGSKGSMGALQSLSALYGLEESRRVKKLGAPPNGDVTKLPGFQAGQQAVMRSMASQGYQGSGNMMAAMQKYGQDAYYNQANLNMQSAQSQSNGIMGELSSLGLLVNGIGKMAGW